MWAAFKSLNELIALVQADCISKPVLRKYSTMPPTLGVELQKLANEINKS